jgi:hypothetical protein
LLLDGGPRPFLPSARQQEDCTLGSRPSGDLLFKIDPADYHAAGGRRGKGTSTGGEISLNWSDRLGGNFARRADRNYEDSGVGWRIWKRLQNTTAFAIRRCPSGMDPVESLVDQGRCKAIGLSDVNVEKTKEVAVYAI